MVENYKENNEDNYEKKGEENSLDIKKWSKILFIEISIYYFICILIIFKKNSVNFCNF